MHHLDYPICETLHRWHLVDAHSQDGAGSMSLPLVPLKAANTSFMTICNQSPLRLPKMQDQISLTLRWPSYPGWAWECVSPFLIRKVASTSKKQWCTMVNILRLTIGHLYSTIQITTTETEPEIGPNGSRETQQQPLGDGYASGIGLPRHRGSGLWTGPELNRPIFLVQILTAGRLPGPVANSKCLKPDCNVELAYANQGMKPECHNIRVQYTESNLDNTF